MAYIFIMALFSIIVFILNIKTKFIWKIQAYKKWKDIQPDIRQIHSMYSQYCIEGKQVGWFNKNLFKETKSQLYQHRNNLISYIDFCESKNLEPKIQPNPLMNEIEKVEDAILNPSDLLNKELNKAEKKYDEEYKLISSKGETLLKEREETVQLISDVECLINSIAFHPKEFVIDFEEIKIEKQNFQGVIEFAKEQSENLERGSQLIGAGLTAGGFVASTAPTAAMWVATTFGTASTGTAISALSGAAASNAAIAWLGDGALATGGGGMAAGQALLALAGPVGWGIAGTTLLASVLLTVKKRFKLQEKKKDEIIKLQNLTNELRKVGVNIEQLIDQTVSLKVELSQQFQECLHYDSTNYSTLNSEDKQILAALVNNTKTLSKMLSKTVESNT